MDVEKHLRKYHRCASAVQAAQASVAAHADMRRIVSDQVEAKTANASALANAEAKLAEAQAQLFDARVESITAKAELDELLGDAK
jgi:outer membrane protein TolC